MELVSYHADDGIRVAGLRGDSLIDLQDADANLPSTMRDWLNAGRGIWSSTQAAIASGEAIPLQDVRIAPPVPHPAKIVCVGLNYADHAAESGSEPPPEPVIFNKFPTALRSHGETIELPSLSTQVDYEAELVVVIGREGKHISESEALEYVAGYCCGHDVSARDWQLNKPGKQWLLGKTFDTFAPVGPKLVTADVIPDPGNLRIQFRLNGETMQDSHTSQLIFSVPHLVAYLSGVVTLLPGDLIFTGTPPGVGVARKPPVFLQAGDTAEVEIEHLGVLSNPVSREPS